MKTLRKVLVSILFGAGLGLCGAAGSVSLNALLNEADDVVVATVRNSSGSAGVLSLELVVGRTLKGSAVPGTNIYASFSHRNVIDGSATALRENRADRAIMGGLLVGKTGLWFLKQSSNGSTVLPLMTGDISGEDLFLPLPAGNLNPTYVYDASADPKTKLIQEISAAAQDPATAPAIWRLEAMRQLAGLGPDQTQAMFSALVTSSQAAARATGLAGLTRQGTPRAIIAIAAMDLSSVDAASSNQLRDAVCEYRNKDAAGIKTLGTLLSTGMKTCAVYALREIHSRETLPLLQALLSDDSQRIRYDAVIGIAQFALGFPVASIDNKVATVAASRPSAQNASELSQHYPGMGLFNSNEQPYISYWKNWLAANVKF